jgi:glutathione transport system permease protein
MNLAILLRRLGALVVTVVIVSITTFFAMRLVPGDPARLVAGSEASPEVVAALRLELGLDQPLPVQLERFLVGLLKGHLGISYRTRTPVWAEVRTRLWPTLLLTLCGMGIALMIGGASGILAAVHRGSWIDSIVAAFSTMGISVPVFWVGILLMMVFAAWLRWVPSTGWGSWKNLILPSVTIGIGVAASISRMARSSMVEVLQDDYVRTAVAKGLPRGVVLIKHALRNALIPIITVAGLEFGRLLGGAVITESVFAWPGLGRLMVDSMKFRDYPTVQACVLLFAVSIAVSTFLSDLLIVKVDPRLGGR